MARLILADVHQYTFNLQKIFQVSSFLENISRALADGNKRVANWFNIIIKIVLQS